MLNCRPFAILSLVFLFLLQASCASKHALDPGAVPTTSSVPDYCSLDANPREHIDPTPIGSQISKEDFSKFISSEQYNHPGSAVVHWRGDLNSDTVDDYIVTTGNSGNRDREYLVLASCPDGNHAKVFQDYFRSIKVQDNLHSNWKTIINEKWGPNKAAQCPESSNGPKMISYFSALEFVGGNYTRTRAWKIIPNPPCM